MSEQTTMGLHVVTMPKLGESVTEGTITAWLKNVGDRVELDDPLFEVSTDKVDSEIPSPFEGTLLEILVGEGETVAVGTKLARLRPLQAVEGAPPAATAEGNGGNPDSPSYAGNAGNGGNRGNGGGLMLSPVVRRLAAEHAVDLSTVTGTGEGGRIMREDIAAAIARSADTDPRVDVQPLSRFRLVTAERMVESKRISPHVWTSIEVDFERVEDVRRRHKDRFKGQEGVPLTYLVFIARAVCEALRAFPALNSSIDLETKTQRFHRFVHLGIAVDLDGRGLVAPVIRDADSLNLRGLARAIRQKADGAHAGRLSPDDYTGSTFTITNPGPYGDYASAPIINQPNVGILSTNMVSRRPTVVADAIAIHHLSILGISYDHRAIDGVGVSKFLRHVKDSLEQRDWEAELG